MQSFDPQALAGEVKPLAIFVMGMLTLALLCVMHFVPQARAFTGFHDFLPTFAVMSSALLASSVLSFVWARPHARAFFTIVDTALYCLAMVSLMIATRPFFRYVAGMLYVAMAMDYGRRHSFGPLMLLAVGVLPWGFSMYMLPDWSAIAITTFGVVIFVITSAGTGRQRELVLQREKLDSALNVTDQVASKSMDVAIASTIADLGRYLHDLRNAATPVHQNLLLIQRSGKLSGDDQEALADAIDGSRRSADLIERILETIKSRSEVSGGRFMLAAELGRSVKIIANAFHGRIDVVRKGEVPPFEVSGNPEHLGSILENLVRNAADAGARHVTVSVGLDGGTRNALVLVSDDGPGIPEAIRDTIMDAPVSHGKKGVHGFGIYVSRRLAELLGGCLELASTGPSGTAFSITLPGRYAWGPPSIPPGPASGPAPGA